MRQIELPIPIIVKWKCSVCGTENEKKTVYHASEEVRVDSSSTKAEIQAEAKDIVQRISKEMVFYQKENLFKYEGFHMRCQKCGHKEYWARLHYFKFTLWKVLLFLFVVLPAVGFGILSLLYWLFEEVLRLNINTSVLFMAVFLSVYLIPLKLLYKGAERNKRLLDKIEKMDKENEPHVFFVKREQNKTDPE